MPTRPLPVPSKPVLEKYLSSLYFNLDRPGSFRGIDQLLKEVRRDNKYRIGRAKIKRWLSTQNTYSLHKPVKHKFKREKVLTNGLNYQVEIDLASVASLSKYNRGVKFLFFQIDDFSRFLKVLPLKSKQTPEILSALERTLGPVQKVYSDRGGEFTSRRVEQYFKSRGIDHFLSSGGVKCSIVERSIRTFKSVLFKYLDSKQTYHFLDILQKLVDNYNRTPHSSLGGLAPNQITPQNEVDLMLHQYYPERKGTKRNKSLTKVPKRPSANKRYFKLAIGDSVRIAFTKKTFSRDYMENFTTEIFTVVKRFLRHSIPRYKLKDSTVEPIIGTFYETELQKVSDPENIIWRINKVIRKRTRHSVKEVLVSWQGFDKKFDSWIPASSLKNY